MQSYPSGGGVSLNAFASDPFGCEASVFSAHALNACVLICGHMCPCVDLHATCTTFDIDEK